MLILVGNEPSVGVGDGIVGEAAVSVGVDSIETVGWLSVFCEGQLTATKAAITAIPNKIPTA